MTDEWKLGAWNRVKTGDKVRLEPHNDQAPIIEGFVSDLDLSRASYVTIRGLGFTQFQAHHYALFVEAKPAFEPPTEPGFYQSKTGALWHLDEGGNFSPARFPTMNSHPENFAPFTRLSPEADTRAVAFAEAIEWLWSKRADLIEIKQGDDVRALMLELDIHFGVTS